MIRKMMRPAAALKSCCPRSNYIYGRVTGDLLSVGDPLPEVPQDLAFVQAYEIGLADRLAERGLTSTHSGVAEQTVQLDDLLDDLIVEIAAGRKDRAAELRALAVTRQHIDLHGRAPERSATALGQRHPTCQKHDSVPRECHRDERERQQASAVQVLSCAVTRAEVERSERERQQACDARLREIATDRDRWEATLAEGDAPQQYTVYAALEGASQAQLEAVRDTVVWLIAGLRREFQIAIACDVIRRRSANDPGTRAFWVELLRAAAARAA